MNKLQANCNNQSVCGLFFTIFFIATTNASTRKILNNVLQKQLEPIRNKRHEYEKDIPGVYEILRKGTEAAYEVAQQTLNEVKASMKINYFDDAQLIKVQSEKYSGIED